MKLYDYQQEAIDGLRQALREGAKAPLAVVPTGGGKTFIIAGLIDRAKPYARIVVCTHVKELVQQNFAEYVAHFPLQSAGIYSAGLKQKRLDDRVTFAGVQSLARAEDIGHVDILIVDEAHSIPKKGAGLWRTLIAKLREVNPKLIIIGLTATPYRLDGGMIHEGEGAIFDRIAYEVPIKRLLDDGKVAPLTSKVTPDGQIDTTGVKIIKGEFDEKELTARAMDKVKAAARDMVRLASERKKWIVFCCGIQHARQMALELCTLGVEACFVDSTMTGKERDAAVEAIRTGAVRAICNTGILTTGFNVRDVDFIALVRPTMSAGLYVQMVGRGLRTADGKSNCLVADYGGNIKRHGPVDDVKPPRKKKKGVAGEAPIKICPECHEVNHAARTTCISCGHEFSREVTHERKASNAVIMKSNEQDRVRYVQVLKAHAQPYVSRAGNAMMKVVFETPIGNIEDFFANHPEPKRRARKMGAEAYNVDALHKACKTVEGIFIDFSGTYKTILDYKKRSESV